MRHHKHPAGSLERLYADHRRMRLVYGVAIIIITLVTTYMYATTATRNSAAPLFSARASAMPEFGSVKALGGGTGSSMGH